MSDPVSRLEFARDEIDRVFGHDYAVNHPEVVVAVMQTAASDFAALAIARAIQDVAAALLVEEGVPAPNGGLVRAGGLVRP
jgi:hypothetical protein